jgi:hypothetical protein
MLQPQLRKGTLFLALLDSGRGKRACSHHVSLGVKVHYRGKHCTLSCPRRSGRGCRRDLKEGTYSHHVSRAWILRTPHHKGLQLPVDDLLCDLSGVDRQRKIYTGGNRIYAKKTAGKRHASTSMFERPDKSQVMKAQMCEERSDLIDDRACQSRGQNHKIRRWSGILWVHIDIRVLRVLESGTRPRGTTSFHSKQ